MINGCWRKLLRKDAASKDSSLVLRSRMKGNFQVRFWRPVRRGNPPTEFSENQVKNTIARRMKGQGKCWKNEGARAMVKILTSINNGWYSFEDYLNIFSLNRKPLELPKKLKEKIVISKGRKETYQMEQIYKGTIPCFAPSSSPTGHLKKEFSDIDYMDVLHI